MRRLLVLIGLVGALPVFAGWMIVRDDYSETNMTGIVDGNGDYYAFGIYDTYGTFSQCGVMNNLGCLFTSGILDSSGDYSNGGILDQSGYRFPEGILTYDGIQYNGGIYDSAFSQYSSAGIWDGNNYHSTGIWDAQSYSWYGSGVVSGQGVAQYGLLDIYGTSHSGGILQWDGYYSATGIFDGYYLWSAGIWDGTSGHTMGIWDGVNYNIGGLFDGLTYYDNGILDTSAAFFSLDFAHPRAGGTLRASNIGSMSYTEDLIPAYLRSGIIIDDVTGEMSVGLSSGGGINGSAILGMP